MLQKLVRMCLQTDSKKGSIACAESWEVLICVLGVLQEQRHHTQLPFLQEAS